METLCSIGHARGFLWGGGEEEEAGGGAGAEVGVGGGVGLPFQRARGVCVLPLLIPVSRETGARQTRDWERGERETERYCITPVPPYRFNTRSLQVPPLVIFAFKGT